jgi:hypothetical protein
MAGPLSASASSSGGLRLARRALDVATNPLRRRGLSFVRRRDPGPRVLAISVPKAGTHLLASCLEAFPELRCYHRGVRFLPVARYGPGQAAERALGSMRGGMFASTHVGWSSELEDALEEMRLRTLLLIRDPRDVVVSFAMFALTRRRHPQHRLFASLPDDDARIRTAIAGCPELGEPPRVLERFARMRPWVEHGARLVRFENLVGAKGGGSEAAQLAEIGGIAAHLGIDLTPETARAVARKTFDPAAPTFRRGVVGDWRHHFTAEHEALFERVAGSLLLDLGYARDPDGSS